MKKLDLQREITKLKAQIVELERKLEKERDPAKYEFWKPNDRGGYYAISRRHELAFYQWDNLDIDKEYQKLGLLYKNKGQAEYEANCMKYKHLYRRYIQEHTEPLNWEDTAQKMYYAVYKPHYTTCVQIDYDIPAYGKYAETEYASSGQIIRDAIQFVGEDNFKKYVLEIEE